MCFAATPAVQCPSGTTLEGVWVNGTIGLETCNIVIPPPVELFECVAGPGVNPDLIGANVTDLRLCEAPTSPNICPIGTDLEGVFVNSTMNDCDFDAPITGEAQCIKCADLASDSGNSQQDQNDVAALLIGNQTNNVFTICNDTDTAEAEFNATIQGSPVAGEEQVTDAFKLCLENAPALNTTPPGLAQAQISSLQGNSLTANVKPEAEISSLNTEAQNPGISQLEQLQQLQQQLQSNNIKSSSNSQQQNQNSIGQTTSQNNNDQSIDLSQQQMQQEQLEQLKQLLAPTR